MKPQASLISTERVAGRTRARFPFRPGVTVTALVWVSALSFAILLWSLAFAAPAEAKLSRVGPADPETKLPLWIEDEAGLRLQPCFDQERCLPLSGSDQELPGNGSRQYAAYWSAKATMPTNDGGSASLLLTTRGSFRSSGGKKAYAQQVSSEIHVSVDNLEPGETYKVTHPYGTETFTSVGGGRGGIDFTEEIGCLQAPCDDFSAALNGRVGPWLTAEDPGAASPGHIGDASTPREVAGSPVVDENGRPQNYFEIEGPNVGGPGVDVVKTRLFTLKGGLYGLTAFAEPRGGNYDEAQSVILSASEPGGEIFYTTDGARPTEDSAPYKDPIPIKKTTLKFVVVGPEDSSGNRPRSPVLTETYTINGTGSD